MKKTTAVLLRCSDPRLEEAAAGINRQLKEILEVEAIISLPRPGVVGLYADEKAYRRPVFLGEVRSNLDDNDVRRMGLEADIGPHITLHQPNIVAIVGHEDCKGYPGDNAHQEKSALIAAKVLRHRLRRRFGFSGLVCAANLEMCANPGWRVKLL